MKLATRSRSSRFLLSALVALVVSGMVALGFSAPAFAVSQTTVTVKIVNKAGTAVSASAVYPIMVSQGAVTPGGADSDAMAAVSGKPGYFTADLLSGTTYTLEIDPTGTSANDGTWQLLGGGQDIDQALTFTPTGSTYFLTATFDNEGTITGKITSPTGAALKGAEADIYYYDGGQWQLGSYALTGSTGIYTLTNLQPGSYKLKFWSPTGAYPPVYSGGVATLDAAPPVVLAAGKTLSVNAKFAAYTGSIAGTNIVDDGFGDVYYESYAIATAYPVLAQSGDVATSIDYGHPVSSARSSSKGAWTISNLKPGAYVVHIEPGYYNEGQQWVGATDPSEGLADAKVVTILSGTHASVGQTVISGYFDDSSGDGLGANALFTTYESNGTTPVTAEVTVTNTDDGLLYLSGISTGGNPAELFWGDGSAFTPGTLQPGNYTVTAIDSTGAHEPYTHQFFLSPDTVEVPIDLAPVAPALAFSSTGSIPMSTTTVGTAYSISGETSSRGDGVFSYQWLRDGQPIYGATSADYTSTGADYNHHLSARVTLSSFGFDSINEVLDVAGSASTETLGDAPFLVDGEPGITPATGVYTGTTLQAQTGIWSDTGMSFTYQWQSDNTNIANATSSTYVVKSSDIGHAITVVVQGHKQGYADGASIQSPMSVTPAAHPAPVNTKAPVITKTVSKGVTTWSATSGSWSISGFTYKYEWTIGGVTKSSASKYATTTPASGDPLELTVTAARDGYLSGAKTVIAQKGTSQFEETTAPVITDTEAATNESDGPGQSQVGEHLVVTSSADWSVAGGVVPDGYAYQWYRQKPAMGPGGVAGPMLAIAGATKSTYIVTPADQNYQLSVRETTISATYAAGSAFSNVSDATQSVLLFRTALPVTIRGVAAQGQVLTGVPGAWPISGVTDTYQWRDCPASSSCTPSDDSSYLNMKGQTKATLTYSTSYGNVELQVTGSKVGYAQGYGVSEVALSHAAVNIVTLSNPTMAGLVGGKAAVGVKLTAVSGKYSVSGLTAHYQWVSCTAPDCATTNTSVGTASTYTPTASDLAQGDIMLIETVTRVGYTQESTNGDDSTQTQVVAGTLKTAKAPTVATGSTAWTVNNGTYSVAGGTSLVLWYVDGQLQNADDTTSQQSLDREFSSQAVWETSSYTVPGYNPVTTQLLVERGSEMSLTSPLAISGAAYGDTLGVTPASPYSDPYTSDTIKLAYQWYSNGAAIKGATLSTFKPSTAYINHRIQVKVTGSSSYYNSMASTSPSTFVLSSGTFGLLAQPTIGYSGTLQPGVVMTVSAVVPTGATVTRQWYKSTNGGTSYAAISKATGATYTPAATDVGAMFEVYVTWTKAGYVTQHQYTPAVTVQYSPTLATLTPPVVTGGDTVGVASVANPGTWNTPSLTYTYQWYRDGQLIPGATASTFTPDFTTETDTLSFAVTASRTGYQPVTVMSNEQPIGAGTITAVTLPKITGTASSTTFSVSTGSWNVDGLTFSYQWQLGSTPISGATTDTYTRSVPDAGLLNVVITVTRPGYNTLPITVNGPTLTALP